MKTEHDLRAAVIRKLYVWNMSRGNTRVKPETKIRMKREFEETILEYAFWITQARWEQEQMNDYKGNLM